MISFYTLPGNESFAPRVSHPHEDAGADIRLFAQQDRSAAVSFFREYEDWMLKYGTRLFVDGEVFTSESESDFLQIVDECGGAGFLRPGCTELFDTGFKTVMDAGSLRALGHPWSLLTPVYKIVPRSGLAHNHRITVTNSPGIVDAGYKDWVKVSLTNNGEDYHAFTHGSRIAQGICELVVDQTNAQVITTEAGLAPSLRSEGGFGSTGV